MYNPNIPQGDDSPKNQAPLIQTDFSQFASIFSTVTGGNVFNHTFLNNPSKQGSHETIIFEKQSKIPKITNPQAILFNQNAASKAGTQPQLFMKIPKYLPTKYDGNTPNNDPMQLTYNQVNTSGPQYQSFMAGGYLLFFGQINITSGNTSLQTTLTPAPTKILMVQAFPNVTTNNVARAVSATIDTNNKFTIYINTPSVNVPITWWVIATV